jgi:Flp pilus assembly secretin CpaC
MTVFIGDSDVADVQLQPPEFIYLNAKKPGTTVLYAADNAGNVLLNTVIQVTGPVTIIKGAVFSDGGQPAPGPVVLQIPLQAAAPKSP